MADRRILPARRHPGRRAGFDQPPPLAAARKRYRGSHDPSRRAAARPLMLRRRRRFDVSNATGSRLHDIPADQLHLADLLDASGDTLQLLAGKQALEDAASVRKGNNDDVAHIRNLVAEQHSLDPQLHVPDGPVVDDRIAPCLEHPQETVILLAQNSALDETGEGALADCADMFERLLDPIVSVTRPSSTARCGRAPGRADRPRAVTDRS